MHFHLSLLSLYFFFFLLIKAKSFILHLESSIPHTDSGIGEEQVANILNGAELETSTGPDAMSELLSTLSNEVKKSQESLTENPSEILKRGWAAHWAGSLPPSPPCSSSWA